MNLKEQDDVKHALKQLLSFYDKPFDEKVWGFWKSVLLRMDHQLVMRALREYLSAGKYAPKPAHIVELVDTYKYAAPVDPPKPPEERVDVVAPEVAAAWQWYINCQLHERSLEGELQRDEATVKRYLETINRTASDPTSIAEEFRLSEYWG